MSDKFTVTDIIAKAVIEDYRLEILKIPEHENHESSPIRPLQQR
jgi:hypothetical protein